MVVGEHELSFPQSTFLFNFHFCTKPVLLGSGETNRKKKARRNKKKRDSEHKDTTPDIVTDETEKVNLRQKPAAAAGGPTKPPRTHSTTASLILSSRDASLDRPEIPGGQRAEVREDKEAAAEADEPRAGAGHQQAAAAPRDAAGGVEVVTPPPRELGARPKVFAKKEAKKGVPESAVTLSNDSDTSKSKGGGEGSGDGGDSGVQTRTGEESLNPLANKSKAKREEEQPQNPLAKVNRDATAATRNPLAKKKEEKPSLNPLARKQEKAPLAKQASVTSRRGSEPAAAENSLPKFRMVKATVVQRQESRKSLKKPKQPKMIVDQDGSRTFVEESSSSDEEEAEANDAAAVVNDGSDGDVDLDLPEFHLELFSMKPDVRKIKQAKKKKATKMQQKEKNPVMVKGLTAEEERALEEAKRAAEEKARLREEERREKVRRAEAEREAKLAEVSKKVRSAGRPCWICAA